MSQHTVNNAYVTLLYDDSYLAGVITLNHSLKKVKASAGLLVLVVNDCVSPASVEVLERLEITYQYTQALPSPYLNTPKVFEGIFTKLRILEMVEYRRIVYIDADMVVCHNVDELFDKPGWSAVNAGGMLPELSDWVDMNAGMLVFEPDPDELGAIRRMMPVLPSKDRGDQGFLHHYFSDWPRRPELHLDHKYNLYGGHLDRYHTLYGYDLTEEKTEKSVCLVHFWGPQKPWLAKEPKQAKGPLHAKAFRLWWQLYGEVLQCLSSDCDPGSIPAETSPGNCPTVSPLLTHIPQARRA